MRLVPGRGQELDNASLAVVPGRGEEVVDAELSVVLGRGEEEVADSALPEVGM